MLIKTAGIVFKTIKYGESSVISDIFTEEKGLHTFVGSSVRTAKSRMPFNLFQPMTVVDMVTYFREEEGSLNRIKEMRIGQVFQSIPFDIRKGAVTLFMAEICRKSIQGAEANPALFGFLLDNLIFLDETEHPIANIHLHFLVGLTEFLGFRPEGEPTGTVVYFDLKEGIFQPILPEHGQYLGVDDTQRLLQLLELPLEKCHEIKMTRAERKGLLHQLLKFYQLHLEGFSGVNTPEILELVLG